MQLTHSIPKGSIAPRGFYGKPDCSGNLLLTACYKITRMSTFTIEKLRPFLLRKMTLVQERELILQNSVDLQKRMLMEIFGALHSALANSVDENDNKWKPLRWDLKEIL